MPFNSELGTYTEGTFTCHPAYAANDLGRPLRYKVDVFGLVSLSGFIRRTGATSAVGAGSKIILCDDPLDLDAYPVSEGYKDMLCRCSEGVVWGLTIESAAITLGGITYPRGCITAVNGGVSQTLTQNVSWFSFDGVQYRLR